MTRSVAVLACLCAAWVQANSAAGQDVPPVYRTWRVYTVRDGLPSDRVSALRFWNDELWVGTGGGLARFKAGVWKSWPTPDDEPPATITGIDIDPDTHDVWFGTLGGGLLRMSAECMSRFTQLNSGLAGDLVFAVAVADKRIWAATNGGVSAYDPVREQWELFAERRADETETAVVGVARQTDRLYYAAWCGGVASIDLKSDISGVLDTSETKVDARPTASDSTIGIASIEDTVWRVTPTSANRVDSKSAGESFALDLPSDAFIECAAFRRPAELWVGSDRPASGSERTPDWCAEPTRLRGTSSHPSMRIRRQRRSRRC
ncbi:MAG: hypothetical protein HZB38_12185 [Planctomycetes bacterium]|nr:hypothetical protein [Planctomycetota bacterium]